MNLDQQRAAFEAWASEKWPGASFSPDQNNCGLVVPERYKHPKLQAAWEDYKAAIASPEVQALRKDAERLDYLLASCVGPDENGWLQIQFETAAHVSNHPIEVSADWLRQEIDDERHKKEKRNHD